MEEALKLETTSLMDYINLTVRKNSRFFKQSIVSKKIRIATLIGNVIDTASSEINHKFKLTEDGKREILFHLSLGSKYFPINLEDLRTKLIMSMKMDDNVEIPSYRADLPDKQKEDFRTKLI